MSRVAPSQTPLRDTGAAAAGVLLRLHDVHRSYQGRPVLRGVSVELRAGQVTWLGGRNGAGKTTLLRVACGLVAPERGTVDLDGLDPWRDRRAFQRRLGTLSAGDRGMYARMTVRQHLELWVRLALLPAAERGPAADRVQHDLGLDELAGRRVDRLSMGQRQRVRLAMALLHDPDVLLLDEPHTSLDEPGLEVLRAVMAGAVARGAALLWLSPSLALSELPHDVALELRDGVVERVA